MKACIFIKPETTHMLQSLIHTLEQDIPNSQNELANTYRKTMIDGLKTLRDPNYEPGEGVLSVRTGIMDESLYDVIYRDLAEQYQPLVRNAIMHKPYGLVIMDLPAESEEEMKNTLVEVKGKFQTAYSPEGTGIRGGMRREYAQHDPMLQPGEQGTLTPPFRSSFVHIPDTVKEVDDIDSYFINNKGEGGIIFNKDEKSERGPNIEGAQHSAKEPHTSGENMEGN